MTSASLQATRGNPSMNVAGVDSVLLGVFITLLMLGLVMVFSSTIAMGSQDLNTNTSHFWRQLVFIILGITATVCVASVPVWAWQKLSLPLLAATLVMLLVLLFVGVEVNGSRRWLSLAGFRLQPAEFAKLAIVLYAASYLTRRQGEITKFSKGIVNMGAVLAIQFCV